MYYPHQKHKPKFFYLKRVLARASSSIYIYNDNNIKNEIMQINFFSKIINKSVDKGRMSPRVISRRSKILGRGIQTGLNYWRCKKFGKIARSFEKKHIVSRSLSQSRRICHTFFKKHKFETFSRGDSHIIIFVLNLFLSIP